MQMDDVHRGESRIVAGDSVHVAKEVDALTFMSRFYERLGIGTNDEVT
jgi:hypothetical protein